MKLALFLFLALFLLAVVSKMMRLTKRRGKRLFQRVNNHFTGHGNGDVYADYKYGDEFTIKWIPLADSGFHTLNELKRDTIQTYGPYSNGYNRTRGNRGYRKTRKDA